MKTENKISAVAAKLKSQGVHGIIIAGGADGCGYKYFGDKDIQSRAMFLYLTMMCREMGDDWHGFISLIERAAEGAL